MICIKKTSDILAGKMNNRTGHHRLKEKPCFIPGNSDITVPGQTNKIPSKITCLVEQAKHYNLPLGIIINSCVATTKARGVPAILINTTKQNIWLQQPLLAAELFTMECHQLEDMANMERREDSIVISFLPATPNTIRVQLGQVEVTSFDITHPTSSDKPAFGPGPNTKAMGFNFEAKINCLPFKLNLEYDAEMICVQQTCLQISSMTILKFNRKDGQIGQVTIGSKKYPFCIPGNSDITVPGQTNKIPSKIRHLVEQAEHHNLPLGIVKTAVWP